MKVREVVESARVVLVSGMKLKIETLYFILLSAIHLRLLLEIIKDS